MERERERERKRERERERKREREYIFQIHCRQWVADGSKYRQSKRDQMRGSQCASIIFASLHLFIFSPMHLWLQPFSFSLAVSFSIGMSTGHTLTSRTSSLRTLQPRASTSHPSTFPSQSTSPPRDPLFPTNQDHALSPFRDIQSGPSRTLMPSFANAEEERRYRKEHLVLCFRALHRQGLAEGVTGMSESQLPSTLSYQSCSTCTG